jgi:hypothetical protein
MIQMLPNAGLQGCYSHQCALRHQSTTRCYMYCHVQVKAFEADVVEALGYKGAIAA